MAMQVEVLSQISKDFRLQGPNSNYSSLEPGSLLLHQYNTPSIYTITI